MKKHFSTSEFTTPDESPGFLLWQVSTLWQRKQRQALAALELTHMRFVLLAGIIWLEKKDLHLSQAQLASHAKTDLTMTSQVLRTLEKRGYITRLSHPKDTRAFSLVSTAKGKEVIAKALVIVEQVDRDFFSLLGSSTQQFTSLLSRLNKETL